MIHCFTCHPQPLQTRCSFLYAAGRFRSRKHEFNGCEFTWLARKLHTLKYISDPGEKAG